MEFFFFFSPSQKKKKNAANITNASHKRQHPKLCDLEFPLIQICLGSVNLMPSFRYSPFSLHVLDVVADLTAVSNDFAPLSAPLLEILRSSEIVSGTGSGPSNVSKIGSLIDAKVPEIETTLRFPEDAHKNGRCVCTAARGSSVWCGV